MITRTVMLLVVTTALAHAATGDIDEQLPQPWHKHGKPPAPDRCRAGIDNEMEARGRANLTLRCDAVVDGFVGAMQSFNADHYLGQRVRFSALVKTADVEGWGGIWMRVDDHGRPNAALATMENRPLKGSLDWQRYSVVLDASDKAQWISFGFTLSGKGQVWLAEPQFEVVGTDVPTTGHVLSDAPANLELAR
jgi:hypothetical protein